MCKIINGIAKLPHRSRKNLEHRLQCSCVQWFNLQYPQLRGRLFAVPNGSSRNKIEAIHLKQEGVTAGVSDLILLRTTPQYGALLIEMKTTSKSSRQSPKQKEWEKAVTSDGEYKYVVCRTFEEFTRAVNEYLNGTI